jgi:hypothetical protein
MPKETGFFNRRQGFPPPLSQSNSVGVTCSSNGAHSLAKSGRGGRGIFVGRTKCPTHPQKVELGTRRIFKPSLFLRTHHANHLHEP